MSKHVARTSRTFPVRAYALQHQCLLPSTGMHDYSYSEMSSVLLKASYFAAIQEYSDLHCTLQYKRIRENTEVEPLQRRMKMAVLPKYWIWGLVLAVLVAPVVYAASDAGLPGDGVYRQAKYRYSSIPSIQRYVVPSAAACGQQCVNSADCLAYSTVWNNKQKKLYCTTFVGDATYPGAVGSGHRSTNWYQFLPPTIIDYTRYPNKHVDGLTPLATHSMTLAPACAALCDSDQTCAAFEVDYNADCYLHGAVDIETSAINQTRSTVFLHVDAAPPVVGCPTPVVEIKGQMAVVGKNERYGWLQHKNNWNTRTPTLQQCLIECDNAPGCVAVNYFGGRRPQCYRLRVGPLNLTMKGYSRSTFAYRCVSGCTDSMAPNFIPEATHDDGSCMDLSSGTSEPFTGNGTLLRMTDCFVRPMVNPDYDGSEVVQYDFKRDASTGNLPYRSMPSTDIFLHEDGTFMLDGTTYPFPDTPVRFWRAPCSGSGLCALVQTNNGSIYFVGDTTRTIRNAVCLSGTSKVSSFFEHIPFPKPVAKLDFRITGMIVLYEDGSVQMCGSINNGAHSTSDPLEFRDVVGPGGAVDVALHEDFSAYLTSTGDMYLSGLSNIAKRCVSPSIAGFRTWSLYKTGVRKMAVPIVVGNFPAVGYIANNDSLYWCIENQYDTQLVFDDIQDVQGSEVEKETLFLFKNGDLRMAYSDSTITFGECAPNGFAVPRSNSPVASPQYLDDQYRGVPIVMENVVSLVPGTVGAVVAGLPEAVMPMNVVPNEVYVHGSLIYSLPLIDPQPLNGNLLRPFLPTRNDPTFSNIVQADGSENIYLRSVWLDADGQVWTTENFPQFYSKATTPEKVALPGVAVQVAAGYQGNFALLENGDVYGWGLGGNKILCGVVNARANAPVLIGSGVSYIYAYDKRLWKVQASDGSVLVCGKDRYGSAGVGGSTSSYTNAPVIDTDNNVVTGVISVKAGEFATGFIFDNGAVHFAGHASYTCQTGVNGGKVNMLDGLSDVSRIGFGNTMVHYQQSDGVTRMCGRTYYDPVTEGFTAAATMTRNHVEIAWNFDEVSSNFYDNIFIRRAATGAVDAVCFVQTACPIGTLVLPETGFTRVIDSGVQEIRSAKVMTLFYT